MDERISHPKQTLCQDNEKNEQVFTETAAYGKQIIISTAK